MVSETSIHVSKDKTSRKALATILIVTLVIVVAVVGYWFLSRSPGYSWLFRGAYSKYYGETTVPRGDALVRVQMNLRIEVLNFNKTHAKILFYMKVETPWEIQEYQNLTWSDLSRKSYEMEGFTLKKTYEQETYIENFGVKVCIIYEFESQKMGTIMTLYVDKQTFWPLKFKLTTEAIHNMPAISLDLNLMETNIPQIKS
ncbi:MAG: hypothetical protein QW717_04400 [Candidatus Bathyarchaeia archaeon]